MDNRSDKHGGSYTKLYYVWSNMKQRILNPNKWIMANKTIRTIPLITIVLINYNFLSCPSGEDDK